MAEKKIIAKETPEVETETVVEKPTNFMNKYMNVISSRFKNVFPVKDDNVKMTLSGELCFPTKTGEVIMISEDGELTEYIDELCCDIPAYSICRPKNTIQVGDYIKYKNTYCRVIKTVDKGLKVVTTSGSEVTKKDIKDFITGLPTFRVIISPFSLMPGINPAFLMMLDGKKSMEDLITMCMFGGGNMMGGNMGMMFMMSFLNNNKNDSKEDMFNQMIKFSIMNQCMGGMNCNMGNNPLGNMFSGMGDMFGGMFGSKPVNNTQKQPKEEVFFSEDENKTPEPEEVKKETPKEDTNK